MFERINTIAMFVIIGIGVLLMILTMSAGLTPEQSDCVECGAVGSFIGMAYILLLVGTVAALGGSVLHAVLNPAGIRGSLIGIIGMVVVLGLSYLLADSEVLPVYGSISETTSRLSGAGLYSLYILLALAILSIAYSSVSRLLK